MNRRLLNNSGPMALTRHLDVVANSSGRPKDFDQSAEVRKSGAEVIQSMPQDQSVQLNVTDDSLQRIVLGSQSSSPDTLVIYWTLVADGSVPPNYEKEFSRSSVLQTETTGRSPRWTTLQLKTGSTTSIRPGTWQYDRKQFVLPALDKPKRFHTRWQKFVYDGPHVHKYAEHNERARWVQVCTGRAEHQRIYSWWMLLQCEDTLRFSDYRGLNPEDFTVTRNSPGQKPLDKIKISTSDLSSWNDAVSYRNLTGYRQVRTFSVLSIFSPRLLFDHSFGSFITGVQEGRTLTRHRLFRVACWVSSKCKRPISSTSIFCISEREATEGRIAVLWVLKYRHPARGLWLGGGADGPRWRNDTVVQCWMNYADVAGSAKDHPEG